jgi:hypothetical protein
VRLGSLNEAVGVKTVDLIVIVVLLPEWIVLARGIVRLGVISWPVLVLAVLLHSVCCTIKEPTRDDNHFQT